MELPNSKRLLRSASYVLTELAPDEEQRMEEHGGRALEKINLIRQTALQLEDVERARDRAVDRPAIHRDRLREGFGALGRLVRALIGGNREEATNLTLAPLAATVPSELIVEATIEAGERTASQAQADLAIEAFRRRMRTAPVGRIHPERLEMYPAGIERGELLRQRPRRDAAHPRSG